MISQDLSRRLEQSGITWRFVNGHLRDDHGRVRLSLHLPLTLLHPWPLALIERGDRLWLWHVFWDFLGTPARCLTGARHRADYERNIHFLFGFLIWHLFGRPLNRIPIVEKKQAESNFGPYRAQVVNHKNCSILHRRLRRLLCELIGDTPGQDLIEYALLTGFISLVAVAAITQVGQGVNAAYCNTAQVVADAGGGDDGGDDDCD